MTVHHVVDVYKEKEAGHAIWVLFVLLPLSTPEEQNKELEVQISLPMFHARLNNLYFAF
jgi:hypothetical protein